MTAVEDFGPADLRQMSRWPGVTDLLNQKCDHCGKLYREPPCENSDHYRTCIDLAMDEAEKPWISFACQRPTELQAAVSPEWHDRRHPYNGRRPEHSGYCTNLNCTCNCHRDEYLGEFPLPE